MANYIKREIDNFDYNDRFYVPNEHRWCFMADDEKFKKYYKEREEYFKPRKTKVQVGEGEVEITGQIGDYTGEFPGGSGDSDEPTKSGQPNNEIWYTTTDKNTIPDPTSEEWSMEDFGSMFISNTYDGEYGILKFDNDIQYIRSNFWEYDSWGLETISIPASVTNIDQNGGFHRCPMKSITFLSQTPPTIREEVIDSIYDDLIIYVPADAVDAYKNAENWTAYADRIQAIKQ